MRISATQFWNPHSCGSTLEKSQPIGKETDTRTQALDCCDAFFNFDCGKTSEDATREFSQSTFAMFVVNLQMTMFSRKSQYLRFRPHSGEATYCDWWEADVGMTKYFDNADNRLREKGRAFRNWSHHFAEYKPILAVDFSFHQDACGIKGWLLCRQEGF